MKIIYVLLLQSNKYYVGSTDDLDRRFAEHLSDKGSEWTRLHKPVKIEEFHPETSIFDEDLTTKLLMIKHGIKNVRGGSHSSLEFPEEELYFLQQEIWHAQGCCLACGRPGHFAATCFAKTTVDGDKIVYYCEDCDRDFPSKGAIDQHRCRPPPPKYQTAKGPAFKAPGPKCPICFKCGIPGHYANECWK